MRKLIDGHVVFGLVLLVAGCGGDSRVNISGTVTLNGNPVEQGTIDFIPSRGDGPTAGAPIQNGNYTVRLQPGEKSVVIHGYREKGRRHAISNDPNSPLVPILEEIVPPRYHSPSQTVVEVTESKSIENFTLTSSP